MDNAVAPSEIWIALRAKWLTSKIEQALRAARIDCVGLARASDYDEAVRIGTMHRMKGLEFRCMCVAGVNAKTVPAANAVTPIVEDKHKHKHQLDLERERCLLFVACTRAREELLVTWNGSPSPFLTALQADGSRAGCPWHTRPIPLRAKLKSPAGRRSACLTEQASTIASMPKDESDPVAWRSFIDRLVPAVKGRDDHC